MPEKTLNDLPGELRKIYSKGYEAYQRENFDYAIELFNQILVREPANYECRQALRGAQRGKSGAKTGFFKRALSSASSSPMVAKGQLALRKNPQEAIQIAEQILNSDANSVGAHKIVAEAALALDMPRTAVMSLEVMHRNSPEDKDVAFQLVDACIAASDKPKAEKILNKLREVLPNDGEVYQKLKDLSARQSLDEGGYSKLGTSTSSYRDVLKDKEETIKLEQESKQVRSEDRNTDLLKDYESRVKNEPTNLKLLRNLAELYAERKDFDRAIEFFEKWPRWTAATILRSNSRSPPQRSNASTLNWPNLTPVLRTTPKRPPKSPLIATIFSSMNAKRAPKDIPRT